MFVNYRPGIQTLHKNYHGSVVPTMDPELGGTEYGVVTGIPPNNCCLVVVTAKF